MKKLSILMVGAVLVLSASLAFAEPWGRGYGMAPYAASPLNLTAEQTGKLQTLRETYLKEVTPLQNQLYSKRAELRLLWGKQSPDQAEIAVKQKEIFEIQQQLQEKATKYQFDCRSVLTPDQQSRMAALGPG